jgi:hypothetical protein
MRRTPSAPSCASSTPACGQGEATPDLRQRRSTALGGREQGIRSKRPAEAGRLQRRCWCGKGYFFQSVVEDHELLDQLDRVGSIAPDVVLEQLQLHEDRDQLERSALEAVDQLERLQRERV